MIDVLILAGGFGTRLGKLTKQKPKPMLKINDKVFLTFIIDFLYKHEFKKIYISAGFKKKVIKNFFYKNDKYNKIKIISESRPLGTGGAVKFFLNKKKNIKI